MVLVVVVVGSCLGQERGDTLARRRLALSTRQRQPTPHTRIQVTTDPTYLVSWVFFL